MKAVIGSELKGWGQRAEQREAGKKEEAQSQIRYVKLPAYRAGSFTSYYVICLRNVGIEYGASLLTELRGPAVF